MGRMFCRRRAKALRQCAWWSSRLWVSPPRPSDEYHETASPAARVRQYAAHRAEEEREAAQAVVLPLSQPSTRPFSQLLAAFMEEGNIRWGELVGGLLIVGGSIALVL